MPQQKRSNTNDLMHYAGLGMQIFAALGITVFIGYKADAWLQVSFPLLVWALPLATLCLMIYKLIKDTSKRNNENAK